jgi:hypothetical protein
MDHTEIWLIEYSKEGQGCFSEEIIPKASQVTKDGNLVLKAVLAKPAFNPRNPDGWRTYRYDRIRSIQILGTKRSIVMGEIIAPKPDNDN